jgi:hypothetical protein
MQWDPHAQAAARLRNDVSVRIAAKLGENKLGAKSAAEAQRCLACHATRREEARDERLYHVLVQDGVACESCHGGAEKWKVLHTQYDWATRGDKRELGFRDTRGLLTRSRLCADCHVGSPGREVDHDLIAAGHPRLNFEFSVYLAKMPAHWDRARDHAENGNDADAWWVGQLTAAEAALRQLNRRAENSAEAPWPEFSEYDCFSCHHDLQAASWRQKPALAGRPAGIYRWGTWYFPLLADSERAPLLAKQWDANGEIPMPEFQELRELMGKPVPNRSQVSQRAQALAGRLAECSQRFASKQTSLPDGSRLLELITLEGQQLSSENWDAAAQVYLAAFAGHRAVLKAPLAEGRTPPPNSEEIERGLEKIRKLLQFGPGYDSPRAYAPDAVQQINAELQRIRDLLPARGEPQGASAP